MKFTLEEKSQLKDVLDSSMHPVLLKTLKMLEGLQEKELLTLNLEDERKIILAKAKYEGAKKLVSDFSALLTSLRK